MCATGGVSQCYPATHRMADQVARDARVRGQTGPEKLAYVGEDERCGARISRVAGSFLFLVRTYAGLTPTALVKRVEFYALCGDGSRENAVGVTCSLLVSLKQSIFSKGVGGTVIREAMNEEYLGDWR